MQKCQCSFSLVVSNAFTSAGRQLALFLAVKIMSLNVQLGGNKAADIFGNDEQKHNVMELTKW